MKLHNAKIIPFFIGFKYYFNYTFMDNPKLFDPTLTSLSHKLDAFKKLSDKIGPEKVIWRLTLLSCQI